MCRSTNRNYTSIGKRGKRRGWRRTKRQTRMQEMERSKLLCPLQGGRHRGVEIICRDRGKKGQGGGGNRTIMPQNTGSKAINSTQSLSCPRPPQGLRVRLRGSGGTTSGYRGLVHDFGVRHFRGGGGQELGRNGEGGATIQSRMVGWDGGRRRERKGAALCMHVIVCMFVCFCFFVYSCACCGAVCCRCFPVVGLGWIGLDRGRA